ncbi:DinB family protein [Serinicoccus kebangsaanensis]|uniref:DinB family protein n=1 Tax=Serinicoccus kebangsaanensis TaxID=2602069 RepID=UPI00124E6680|nr:DinB family protein [Serinicoccus kebangsaanensis]
MDALTTALTDQLDRHWRGQARPRLEGLTDEEYLWEPVAGAWSVRPRESVSPPTADARVGGGVWLLDDYDPAHAEPDPAPVTTIAWRLAHLTVQVLGSRAAALFDGPACSEETWRYAGSAAEALDQLDTAYAAWTDGVRGLDEPALRRPTGSPDGPWAERSMLTLVLHVNREVIHHLSEVALLRDLRVDRAH